MQQQSASVAVDLATLGPIVGLERTPGRMSLASWMGETTAVWATFDCEPGFISNGGMREHMLSAVNIEAERPLGALRAICFKQLTVDGGRA